jgi:hypothetical protein
MKTYFRIGQYQCLLSLSETTTEPLFVEILIPDHDDNDRIVLLKLPVQFFHDVCEIIDNSGFIPKEEEEGPY